MYYDVVRVATAQHLVYKCNYRLKRQGISLNTDRKVEQRARNVRKTGEKERERREPR